jgi:hypothetical protein
MRNQILLSSWFLGVSTVLMVGCSESRTDPASPLFPAEAGTANLWDYDPCFTNAAWVCHAAPTFFGGGFDPYGSEFNCPDGCTTVALSTAMRSKVRDLTSARIKTDASCSWAKNYLTTALNFNRIRWYVSDDGKWGDSHWTDNSNATNADVHVWQGAFGSDEQLIRTLMHEAAHVHFQIEEDDDPVAEAYSNACYQP